MLSVSFSTHAKKHTISESCLSNRYLDYSLCVFTTLSEDGKGEDAVFYKYSESSGYLLLRNNKSKDRFSYRSYISDKGSLIAIGQVEHFKEEDEQQLFFSYQIYYSADFFNPDFSGPPIAILDDPIMKNISEFKDNGIIRYDLKMEGTGCVKVCPIEVDGMFCQKTFQLELVDLSDK